MKTPYSDRSPSLVILAALLTFAVAPLLAQTISNTVRLSQNAQGTGQLGQAGRPALSANGRVYAFSSTAENLVDNDSNNRSDIFVGSLTAPALVRVSVGRNGVQANGGSFNPSVSPQSANGFLVVAYASDASNIGRALQRFPDDNNERDIYFSVPKRPGFTKRVSYGLQGAAANGPSRNPSVTIVPEPNRMVVAYQSSASNLVQTDTNGVNDIFITTLRAPSDDPTDADETGTALSGYSTQRVSVAANPAEEPNGASTDPQISGDASAVVFESVASNLVAGVTPTTKQIYLRDLATNTTELISRAVDGTPGNGESFNASLSFQGTYVVYSTLSSNVLSDGITSVSGALQVVLYNRKTKRSTRVNVSSSGEAGNAPPANSFNAVVSPNGRLVLFSDQASNLVTGDVEGFTDIFARDTVNRTTVRVVQSPDGTGPNGGSIGATLGQESFTSLSSTASFLSIASNLVANDSEGGEDVFASTLSLLPPLLTRATILEVPSDVTPSADAASITMEKFTLPKSKRTTRKTLRTILQYSTLLYRERPDGKRADVRRKTSSRNTVTFRNLTPGTYVTQYRTQLKTGDAIKNRSAFSPPSRFTVGEQDEGA
jgi:hypothetical protein